MASHARGIAQEMNVVKWKCWPVHLKGDMSQAPSTIFPMEQHCVTLLPVANPCLDFSFIIKETHVCLRSC